MTVESPATSMSNDKGSGAVPTRPPMDVLIPAMVERIVNDFQPIRIVLFGSRARGDARWDSDVDLLIVLSSVTSKHETTADIRRALRGFPVSKDIVIATPDEIARYGDMVGRMLRPALREGIVLYAR